MRMLLQSSPLQCSSLIAVDGAPLARLRTAGRTGKLHQHGKPAVHKTSQTFACPHAPKSGGVIEVLKVHIRGRLSSLSGHLEIKDAQAAFAERVAAFMCCCYIGTGWLTDWFWWLLASFCTPHSRAPLGAVVALDIFRFTTLAPTTERHS